MDDYGSCSTWFKYASECMGEVGFVHQFSF